MRDTPGTHSLRGIPTHVGLLLPGTLSSFHNKDLRKILSWLCWGRERVSIVKTHRGLLHTKALQSRGNNHQSSIPVGGRELLSPASSSLPVSFKATWVRASRKQIGNMTTKKGDQRWKNQEAIPLQKHS